MTAHFRPKFRPPPPPPTPGRLSHRFGRIRADQILASSGPTLVEFGTKLVDSAPFCPIFRQIPGGRIRTNLAIPGQFWSTSVGLGQTWSISSQVLPISGKMLPLPGHVWSMSVGVGPNSVDWGQSLVKLGPSLANSGQCWAACGRIQSHTRRIQSKFGRFPPKIGRSDLPPFAHDAVCAVPTEGVSLGCVPGARLRGRRVDWLSASENDGFWLPPAGRPEEQTPSPRGAQRPGAGTRRSRHATPRQGGGVYRRCPPGGARARVRPPPSAPPRATALGRFSGGWAATLAVTKTRAAERCGCCGLLV